MDDYLKFRALHQGSPAGSVEQYERTYQSPLGSLQHDAPRALTRDAVERWVMAELERGVSARTMSSSRVAHVVSLGDHLVRKRQDADLDNFLRYVDSENLSTPPVSRMMSAYANALAAGGGQITDEGIAAMERKLGNELHPQQRELLKKWLREELNVNLRRMRRR